MSTNQDQSQKKYEENDYENDRKTMTLGLVPAPELPEEIVSKVVDDLPDLLSRYVDKKVNWQVESVTDPLTGIAGSSESILDAAENSKVQKEWDMAVCVTDLPIFQNRMLVVADVSAERNLAVISLPSLGAAPIKRRVREAIIQMASEMYHGSSDEDREQEEERMEKSGSDDEVSKKGTKQLMSTRLTELVSPITRKTYSESGAKDDENSDIDVRYLVNSRVSGGLRLIFGMLYANRPWTIFPTFKSVLAVAFGTGAYALIFPSLWMLSDEYGPARFITFMVVAISAMVTWIIVAHELWESPEDEGSTFIARRYNIATVLTLLSGVLVYYVILYLLFLAMVSLFVPLTLMQTEIGSAVNAGNYFLLAWLAASLATVVGAVGAGLESEETVLKTTYGYRQRRRKEDAEEQEKGSDE
ncbi:tripartite tricarboxylate transporter TctB family protein [Alteribacter natronophilus]|uniref:tripartite tricarboxylate transporter TctB family protein n=1 Tax=Alteribacter natronophilus TaxID=2583810 RepID=UPI00110F697A|nr:tripartite tricarboxylate transporter TctB family protein [Alteribacter natronophilus]TMW71255.1 tripartite tricarboxylate transporter TctB family protein [Alteribacter natronophilus]